MKEIPLTQGQVALVDDEDYVYLNQWKWHAIKAKYTYYANRTLHFDDGTVVSIRMHRQILGVPQNKETDHIDGNGLNNQKSNLRICNYSQNQYNKRGWGTSGYKGVSARMDNHTNPYRAYISIGGRLVHIGSFPSIEEAALAYNNEAIKHFGKYAKLNVINKSNQ
jgi:hypothetical protein